jgi:hypothetical protein
MHDQGGEERKSAGRANGWRAIVFEKGPRTRKTEPVSTEPVGMGFLA